MADSILQVAGTGPILESENAADAADNARRCEAAILRCAERSDWKAGAWWLQHHPSTRETWSDAARDQALYARHAAATCRGITAWAAEDQIDPHTVRRLVLHMQAAGAEQLSLAPEE